MDSPSMMKAVVCTRYGPPSVLVLREVPKPVPKEDEVLIKIYATSVTASDALIRQMDTGNCVVNCLLQAMFGFGAPRHPILGMTLSGVVEDVGESKTTANETFRVGDAVFAYGSVSSTNRRWGSYAEYLCLPADGRWNLLAKPTHFTHAQAAALPYGAFLAWHCVVTAGKLPALCQQFKKVNNDVDVKAKVKVKVQPHVVIYGASGSIGTMSVQLAKHFGATVTAVCSASNRDLMVSLGADWVIDYTSDDAVAQLHQQHYQQPQQSYDLLVDAVGHSKSSALKAAARKLPGISYVSIDDALPSTPLDVFRQLKDLADQGQLVPVIDRSFSLAQMAEAHAYVDQGHKKGNVVIVVTRDADQT